MPESRSSQARTSSGNKPEGSKLVHRVEWSIGIASGMLVAAMLAYLVVLGLSRDGGSPSLAVEIEDVRQVGTHTHLFFVLRNEGDRTGAQVSVRATLAAGEDEEVREITFDYVPPRSQRRGAFIYEEPVTAGRVRLSVLGYREP